MNNYKIYDRLFFMGSCGLGDSFVLNGIVHHYADRSLEIHVPCWEHFYDTIKSLYNGFDNIKVVPFKFEHEMLAKEQEYVINNRLSRILRIKLIQSKIKNYPINAMWDLQLYAAYELPYHLRYTNFRLPKVIEGSDELFEKLSNNEPYILVHRYTGDHPNGLAINIQGFRQANNFPNINIIEITPNITNNMMQYIKLIENAAEIHCVASSFHCLVDSVPTRAKLFFHDIREKTAMAVNSAWNNNKWNNVSYSERF